MTRQQKSLLFLLVATVVNLVITIGYFLIFLVLSLYFLKPYLAQYGSSLLFLPLVGSILASFFSYRALVKWAERKWKFQQYLGRRH